MRYLTRAMPALVVLAITFFGIATGVLPDLVLAGFLGGLVGIVAADAWPVVAKKWAARKGRGK